MEGSPTVPCHEEAFIFSGLVRNEEGRSHHCRGCGRHGGEKDAEPRSCSAEVQQPQIWSRAVTPQRLPFLVFEVRRSEQLATLRGGSGEMGRQQVPLSSCAAPHLRAGSSGLGVLLCKGGGELKCLSGVCEEWRGQG